MPKTPPPITTTSASSFRRLFSGFWLQRKTCLYSKALCPAALTNTCLNSPLTRIMPLALSSSCGHFFCFPRASTAYGSSQCSFIKLNTIMYSNVVLILFPLHSLCIHNTCTIEHPLTVTSRKRTPLLRGHQTGVPAINKNSTYLTSVSGHLT